MFPHSNFPILSSKTEKRQLQSYRVKVIRHPIYRLLVPMKPEDFGFQHGIGNLQFHQFTMGSILSTMKTFDSRLKLKLGLKPNLRLDQINWVRVSELSIHKNPSVLLELCCSWAATNFFNKICTYLISKIEEYPRKLYCIHTTTACKEYSKQYQLHYLPT